MRKCIRVTRFVLALFVAFLLGLGMNVTGNISQAPAPIVSPCDFVHWEGDKAHPAATIIDVNRDGVIDCRHETKGR